MSDRLALTMDQIVARARSGVAKVDLLGPRGTTLCSMDEIEAMALVIVLSCALPPPGQGQGGVEAPVEPQFQTRRKA